MNSLEYFEMLREAELTSENKDFWDVVEDITSTICLFCFDEVVDHFLDEEGLTIRIIIDKKIFEIFVNSDLTWKFYLDDELFCDNTEGLEIFSEYCQNMAQQNYKDNEEEFYD